MKVEQLLWYLLQHVGRNSSKVAFFFFFFFFFSLYMCLVSSEKLVGKMGVVFLLPEQK